MNVKALIFVPLIYSSFIVSNNPVMEKKLVLYVSILLLSVSFSASAQIYVKIRPIAPVIVRISQPTHTHVWIGDEWEPDGTSYRYSGSHWEEPPHKGDRWNPGHWKHHKTNGHQWIHGNWRGRK